MARLPSNLLRIGGCFAYAVAALIILYLDKADSVGVGLGVSMMAMIVLFLVVAVTVGCSWPALFLGALPSLPRPSPLQSAAAPCETALSLVGTTAIGFNLFLSGSMARHKTLAECRRGIAFSTLSALIVSVLIMIVAAGVFEEQGGTAGARFNIIDLAASINGYFGAAGTTVFALGFVSAALSSMLTVIIGAALAAEGLLLRPLKDVEDILEEPRLSPRSFWSIAFSMVAIAVLAICINLPRPSVILVAQLFNGILLPFFCVSLLLCLTDEKFMGAAPQSIFANVCLYVSVTVTFVLAWRVVVQKSAVLLSLVTGAQLENSAGPVLLVATGLALVRLLDEVQRATAPASALTKELKQEAEHGASTKSLMSFVVHVALLSGRQMSLTVLTDTVVQDLKQRVQQELHVSIASLVGPAGDLLQNQLTLSEAGVADGETLHAICCPAMIASSRRSSAFALIRRDGSVVTWGGSSTLRCSTLQQSKEVIQIRANMAAFAALQSDGSVACWGSKTSGGDSATVQHQLRNVREVRATGLAFAALLADGRVVTWGDPAHGGDSCKVQDQLVGVRAICGSSSAFAALRCDGHVVTWGNPRQGGDSQKVQEELRDVVRIKSTFGAFAALRRDGSVVAWGSFRHGGSVPCSPSRLALRDVRHLRGSDFAFAALRKDGRVVAWGCSKHGGDAHPVQDQLTSVRQLRSSLGAFAALRADGRVVTWGNAHHGGDSCAVREQLQEVRLIRPSGFAFAALRADGRVVTWGNRSHGGDSRAVQPQLTGVVAIRGSSSASGS
ncbi:HERC2 [Symbiodinium pilosum]|uniref:HERC2 protein n=1 Tax=Symbiodinium pilosum TaxID=2952 RepID=A0A812WYY0_SYMPI|nr:HERC2 [Symbiodinium pilosum]